MNPELCQCVKTDGKQCTRNPMVGSKYCWQHQKCKNPIKQKPQTIEKKPQVIEKKVSQVPVSKKLPEEEYDIISSVHDYYKDKLSDIGKTTVSKELEQLLKKAKEALDNGEAPQALQYLVDVCVVGVDNNIWPTSSQQCIQYSYPYKSGLQKLSHWLPQPFQKLPFDEAKKIVMDTYGYYQNRVKDVKRKKGYGYHIGVITYIEELMFFFILFFILIIFVF